MWINGTATWSYIKAFCCFTLVFYFIHLIIFCLVILFYKPFFLFYKPFLSFLSVLHSVLQTLYKSFFSFLCIHLPKMLYVFTFCDTPLLFLSFLSFTCRRFCFFQFHFLFPTLTCRSFCVLSVSLSCSR